MASFADNDVFDNMPGGNPAINIGSTPSMHQVIWGTEGWGQTDQEHWRQHYSSRPYAQADRGHEHYEPAYRYDTVAAHRHTGREWHEVERDLERDWASGHGTAHQSAWGDARHAVRDAWDRARSKR